MTDSKDNQIGFECEVPLDHKNPEFGSGKIYYEFGQPYQSSKPTVIVISDAQQFYIRQGEVSKFQERWFGSSFNVLGIVGRGTSPDFLQIVLNEDESTDWIKAWNIFNYQQWLGDIEAVRKSVLGDEGKVLIYGESGGAMLAHQYLAEYGQHVSRAFTRAVVNPYLVGQLGLNSDRFWKEVEEFDPELLKELDIVLERYSSTRPMVVMTLQRQNFFVPPDQLGAARAKLIKALAAGDDDYFAKVRQEYEVDAVQEVMNSSEAIPIRVRLFEFLAPSGAFERMGGSELYPDYEVQINISGPLIDLHRANKISLNDFPFRNLHKLTTEVFLLAGRWDHVVDYRSTISLASRYLNHHLFLANDDHMFKKFEESGLLVPILVNFFEFGLTDSKYQTALEKASPHRWRES
jgi:pimeloyl-ACP methyl ester carboxylesterase